MFNGGGEPSGLSPSSSRRFYTKVLHEGSYAELPVLRAVIACRNFDVSFPAWRIVREFGILSTACGVLCCVRMAKSFREMHAWQLAFELRGKVVALMAISPQAQKDFKFRDQILESCKSVPGNIAEGYGRYRPAEIARFLEFATGSLDETENHLRDGVGSGYFKAEAVGPLIRLAARCRTAMIRWQRYLQRAKRDPRFQRRKPNRREEPS